MHVLALIKSLFMHANLQLMAFACAHAAFDEHQEESMNRDTSVLFPTLALLFSALPGLPCSFQDRASDQTGAPRDTDDYEPSPDS